MGRLTFVIKKAEGFTSAFCVEALSHPSADSYHLLLVEQRARNKAQFVCCNEENRSSANFLMFLLFFLSVASYDSNIELLWPD